MERVGVGSLIWYPGVLAAGLAGGFVGNVSTTLLFVLVGETLFYFLSLCFTALMAALCAVLAALANVVFVYAVGDGDGLSRIGLGQQMGLSTIVVALVSGLAAGRLRRPPVVAGAEAPRGSRRAVLLIVLASLLLVAGVVIDGISGPVA
jgi:hypothetical protein